MQISDSLKQKAEKCGIALSHYDIDGHLIFADEKTVSTFVELLQPPPKAKGQFDDVLAAFENEPIDYLLNRLDLPPSSEYRYQLIDESNAILLEKILSNLSALSLPPLPFGYYQLSIFSDTEQYRVRLLISPKTSFQPSVLKNKKVWGVNVQLYSLRSEQNWGIGDFGDLAI